MRRDHPASASNVDLGHHQIVRLSLFEERGGGQELLAEDPTEQASGL